MSKYLSRKSTINVGNTDQKLVKNATIIISYKVHEVIKDIVCRESASPTNELRKK